MVRSTIAMEEVPTFQQELKGEGGSGVANGSVVIELKPGSSADSAVVQCAHRVDRIDKNEKLHCFPDLILLNSLNLRTNRCISLQQTEAQSLLESIAFRAVTGPSGNCTCCRLFTPAMICIVLRGCY